MTQSPDRVPVMAPQPGFWRRYADLWRKVPGSVVAFVALFLISMVSVGLLWALLGVALGTLVIFIGIPLLAVTMLVARGFAVAHRFVLRLTGSAPISEPEWSRDAPGQGGFWRRISRPFRGGHYWVAFVHGAIVSPIVSTVSFIVTTTWVAGALGGLTYWFWSTFLPKDDADWGMYVADAVPWLFGGWRSEPVEIVLYLAAGVVFAVTMPWVLGGMTRMHDAIARGMLGRWRSDDLVAEVRAEAAARGAAVASEDAGLRRLERDIHDGPQQRLVRLQMDLAALERRAAAGDAAATAELAREARAHAKVALDELRALSAGVAPPLLQDRGLTAALEASALAAAVPVSVDIATGIDGAVGPDVARAVYFMIAELLTNIDKHAQASAATVKISVQTERSLLEAWVVDNGRGGAVPSTGHGIAGLLQRAEGLRGQVEITSPHGGPTSIRLQIPLGIVS